MRCSLPTGRFFRSGIAAILFGCLSSSAIPSRAESPKGSAAERRTKVYEWFSSLGYPDVAHLECVRVVDGREDETSDHRQRENVTIGFLTKTSGNNFTIFTFDRETRTFKKSAGGAPPEQRVDYQVIDLADYGRFVLDALRREKARTPDGGYSQHFGVPLYGSIEVFALSWACWRKGQETLAGDLFDQTAKGLGLGKDEAGAVQQNLSSEIGVLEWIHTIFSLGDRQLTREQMLATFDRFVKNFPTDRDARRARDIAKILKRMVHEEKEHAEQRSHGKPFEKFSKREQIAELIFQLRDQHAIQVSSPGWCDIFDTFGGFDPEARKGDSPAQRLVKYGYDAVPQLIDALDDDRLSRSIGDDHLSSYVLTVGDCAEQTLSRIAGLPFYSGPGAMTCMSNDGKTDAVKKEIKAWYADLQKKGEKQVLIEAVEKGDDINASAAERLVEKYPKAALAPIVVGFGHARDHWTQEVLVSLAAKIPGESALPFLLQQLKKGPTLGVRLAAAFALHERHRDESVSAMIGEWKNAEGDEELGRLAGFLAGSGKLEAIEALADGLDKRPVNDRMTVVLAIEENAIANATSAVNNGKHAPANAPPTPDQLRLNGAIVKLLVKSLEDTERRTGMSGGWVEHKMISDPRICDMAGYVLNHLDPKRFPFELGAPFEQRERSRLAIVNDSRKEHGLPALASPERRKIATVPDEKLKPLLDRLERAPTADVSAASEAIEKLGPGALNGTLRRMGLLKADSPRRADFDRLARRLATTVVEIQFGEKSLKPDAALKAKLESFKGKPLDAAALSNAVVWMAEHMPKRAPGLRLSVVHMANEAGATLQVDLFDKPIGVRGTIRPNATSPKDRPYAWDQEFKARVDDQTAYHAAGSGAIDRFDLHEDLETVASTPIDKSLDIRIQLIGVWRR